MAGCEELPSPIALIAYLFISAQFLTDSFKSKPTSYVQNKINSLITKMYCCYIIFFFSTIFTIHSPGLTRYQGDIDAKFINHHLCIFLCSVLPPGGRSGEEQGRSEPTPFG